MADHFDALMISTCTIFELDPNATSVDKYGHRSQELAVKHEDVPCRVSTITRGMETRDGKKAAVGERMIYMRPIDVVETNVIEVGSSRFNVKSVENPSLLDHHYELLCEVIAGNAGVGS